jgi:hypothetical protein
VCWKESISCMLRALNHLWKKKFDRHSFSEF